MPDFAFKWVFVCVYLFSNLSANVRSISQSSSFNQCVSFSTANRLAEVPVAVHHSFEQRKLTFAICFWCYLRVE